MNSSILRHVLRPALLLGLLLAVQSARPAVTDLADVPLFTSSSNAVKPNIMLVIDNSGSMASDFMPDEANFATTKYGKLSSQCNGLAYNPAITYALPVDSTGVSLAAGSTSILTTNPNTGITSPRSATQTSLTIVNSGAVTLTFASASASWFTAGTTVTLFSSASTTNQMVGTVSSWTISGTTGTLVVNVQAAVGAGSTLATTVKAGAGNVLPYYYRYTGSQTPLGYTYTSAGVITTTTFYGECSSNVGATPGSGVFTQTFVSTASSEAQNYANWNTYYNTRIKMMKAAIGLAFKDIGDKYRVGYSTISEKTAVAGTNFLDIATFDATQKSLFYTKINAATPSGNTPLRGALSKAGQYFANKAPGQTVDPIQYSCQKNFTIMSTDGYWNTGAETTSYTANDVNGAAVGQQDGWPTAFPMRDSAVQLTTTVTTWNTTRTQVAQTATTTTSYSNVKLNTSGAYAAGTGSRTDTYSGYKTNSSIARCSNTSGACTITVTTSTAHGFTNGSKVTVMGAATATPSYNGTFTITVTGASTYTYSLPSRPASISTAGYSLPAGSCSAGSGSVTRSSTQADTYALTLSNWTTAAQTDTTVYTSPQTVTVTPYTETVVVTNGVQTSDTTVAGTPTVTVTALTPPANTVVNSTYTSATTTSAGTSAVVNTTLTPVAVCVSAPSGWTNGTVSAAPVSTKPTYTPTSSASTKASSTAPTVTTQISDSTVTGTKVPGTPVDGSTGGVGNTLADVAMYYYKTDLRTSTLGNCTGALGAGTNVCQTTDIAGQTTNVTQNMETFTLGLGVNGTLSYTDDYLINPKKSDYFALTQGTKTWPNPTVSTNGGDPTNVDDLWHAAVNGHGQYFSAGDPSEVVLSLKTALQAITERKGSSSAAATSTLQPVDGDNDIFVAQFTSAEWIGDVQKFSINPSDGTISTTAAWSATTQLKAMIDAGTARTVYYFKKDTGTAMTGTLRAFTYANLTTDALNGNFDNFCSKTGAGGGAAPVQCATLTSTDKTTANSGANLVSWLLGASNAVYRTRDAALGDIINSSPIYVGAPKFKYTENNYGTFASNKASRAGTLYVGANDGMLHAFDRATGNEKWAYIPSAVLPNLYKLADTDYPGNHQFFVDGAPQVGDVWDGTNWRTILVGGLNKGGRIYYALDVTDPANPIALWEFSDSNLGLTYGNPVITKRKDGTWVVAFGSGYNNVGDGNGYLYVVNAITGAKVTGSPIPTYTSGTTPAGTATAPSGLSKINAFIASELDNTAKVFYGGDLLGNVWRFDIDSNVAPFGKAFLLANLSVGSTPQPITTIPTLAEINYLGSTYTVVYVGTGRYLGTGDVSNTDQQSIYALKDDGSTTGLGNVRASGKLVTQTISNATSSTGTAIRQATSNAVAWNTKSGWMVDLPSSGERVNVNMLLALNVLSVATNIPTSDVCDAGGKSWLYRFDIGSGAAVSNAPDGAVGIPLGNVLVAGQTIVQLPDGRLITISTLSDTTLRTDSQPPPPSAGTLHRTSWRELSN
jgi:type IV pilus assembly protein PilY1